MDIIKGKKMTDSITEITPEDSVVPVYLVQLPEDDAIEQENTMATLQAERLAIEEQAIATMSAKQSALEKLAALGLTEEEARAIVGV